MEPYYETDLGKLYCGGCLEILSAMPERSVNCCVTSPPYWGLRNYDTPDQVWGGDPECRHDWGDELQHGRRGNRGISGAGGNLNLSLDKAGAGAGKSGRFCRKCRAWFGSLGLEPTPALFVEHMVEIFRDVKRVLRDDGTCWINLGDTYAANRGRQVPDSLHCDVGNSIGMKADKPKNLIGIPWMVAFALQADGWYLRQDIIWHKPNPMPESVTDRCTKSHEYIFLLSKSARYFYDSDAIREPHKNASIKRCGDGGKNTDNTKYNKVKPVMSVGNLRNGSNPLSVGGRNKRSVWTIATKPFLKAHFATFPPALIEPCILAGCPKGGIVLDPFIGSGTTAVVSYKHDRKFVGIELNRQYLDDIAIPRIEAETKQMKMFA